MDRGVVFRIIESVLFAMAPVGTDDDLALVELKLDFLRVITEYKYWVALNLPLPGELTTVKNILPDFVKKHFLASTFLNQVTSYFGHPEQSVRLKTITTLAQLFERHEFDPEYTDKPIAKRRIANVYFPFLLIFSDNIATVEKSMDFGEKRLIFSCVLWVLKNTDPDLIRQWWSRESPKRLFAFFEVLAQTLKVFFVFVFCLCFSHNKKQAFDFLPKEKLVELLGTSKNVLQADSAKATFCLFVCFFLIFVLIECFGKLLFSSNRRSGENQHSRTARDAAALRHSTARQVIWQCLLFCWC
jgi:hypothetical protein